MKFICLIIALIMGALSCKKIDVTLYDSTGVVTKLPHVWRTSITDDNNLTFVSLDAVITEGKNNILVGGGNSTGDRKLMNLDCETGKIKWEWNDRLTSLRNPTYKDPIYISTDTYAKKGNLLFFPYASSSYCIDLTEGKTVWKHKTPLDRFDWCGSIGDKYFTGGSLYNFNF